jgi:hypothetical protein
MPKEINELESSSYTVSGDMLLIMMPQIDYMNDAIRTSTQRFNDTKIQYVNIDPAYNNHRFCEPRYSV